MTEQPDNTGKDSSPNNEANAEKPFVAPPAPVAPNGEFNYRETPIVIGDAVKELGRTLKGSNKSGSSNIKWGSILSVLLAFMLANTSSGFNVIVFLIWLAIFWVIAAPVRAASWVSRRANSRPCPVCGIRIPNGETVCGSCGTDFRQR